MKKTGRDSLDRKYIISVIIVNYNGKRLLRECLDSLREQTFKDFEVIVVDNASSDGSVAFIKENYPEVRIIENAKNLGFGEGNNVGMRRAEGEYIALLNNDAVSRRDWLSELVAAVRRSNGSFGMWASKILFYDHPDIIDTAGHLMYPDGLNMGRGRGEKDAGRYETEEEVFFPSGCAALYSKEMLDKIGYFDPAFFAYGDDTEIGLRARLAGWKCLFVPSSVVYHKYSATTGRYSPFKAYLIERNRIWVLVKYFPLRYIMLSPLYTLTRLYHHFRAAVKQKGAAGRFTGSFSWSLLLKVYVKANVDAVLGIPKMLKKRRRFKEMNSTTTREFSAWLNKFGVSSKKIALHE